MGPNIVKEKSFGFAVEILHLCKFLQNEKKEYILSKQLLRSGTSIGANIREAEHAESKADFIHKMAIAQKENNETLYWIDLLEAGFYITKNEHQNLKTHATELIKLITSILKTAKSNHHH